MSRGFHGSGGFGGFGGFGAPFLGGLAGSFLGSAIFPGYGWGRGFGGFPPYRGCGCPACYRRFGGYWGF
ncbi:hypothetical protein [Sporosarcina sp. HYO08]|uniref:hypothetical protein n=1 Tax=Sporosarcina sp. HYO08 TaxID=1759557 RepID=UPI000794662C|nr:hypothetical protein [Sporosarcina sp. HYO08]KXH79220.1 hypothetical protein AU377_11555 [Sporosarcina sp. HYO08]